jgi:HK97 family phage major capsid protein
VERQIINGDGTGANLKGLFADGNYTPHGFSSSDCATSIDLLSKCIASVQASGYFPTAVLMNPIDWNTITLQKSSDNKYLLGDPASAVQNSIWGIQVVVSSAVPSGKFLVGDFKTAATVYSRQGITVELFEQDEKNVQQNLVTVRAECRKALCVEHPAALVGGSLTLA